MVTQKFILVYIVCYQYGFWLSFGVIVTPIEPLESIIVFANWCFYFWQFQTIYTVIPSRIWTWDLSICLYLNLKQGDLKPLGHHGRSYSVYIFTTKLHRNFWLCRKLRVFTFSTLFLSQDILNHSCFFEIEVFILSSLKEYSLRTNSIQSNSFVKKTLLS